MDRDLGRRTVFIVHAHGVRDSFNAALTRVAVETLTRSGYEVIVSDLYSMNFMPVYGRDESKSKAEAFYIYLHICIYVHLNMFILCL